MMNKRIVNILFAAFLVIGLVSCNLPSDFGGEQGSDFILTVTANAAMIETAQAQGALPPAAQGQPEVVASAPPVVDAPPSSGGAVNPAVDSSTLTATLTPAPDGVIVVVSANTNCRKGPALAYDSVYILLKGDSAKVVGSNPTVPNYWVIEIPDGSGKTCWLWGQYATVTGNTSGLKVFEVPATPTPTITPTSTSTPTSSPTPVAQAPAAPSNVSAVLLTCVTNNFVQTFTATVSWTDNSNNENVFNIYVNANFADGSSKDLFVDSAAANTTSYTVTTTALSKLAPVFKVEAVGNTSSSTRTFAAPLNLSSCP